MGMENNILQQGDTNENIILYAVFLMLFMSIILLLFFYFSKKKIIQKDLEKKDLEIQYQRDLLQATLVVQEEERQRIARDLHDDISSKLNVVSLNSHMLNTPDLTESEVTEITDNIINLVGKALENSRKIAHDLLPPVLEKFGLDAALRELSDDYTNTKVTTIHYNSESALKRLDQIQQLHIFRIIKELINNSIRHGKATAININFKDEEGSNIGSCIYNDNGIGFENKNDKIIRGLGMKNIESRIYFLKGTHTIASEINKGTTITFNFNYDEFHN